MLKDYRSPKQCADYFKQQAEEMGLPEPPIKEWYIRELIKNGDIPYLPMGKKKLVCPSDIEAFIEGRVNDKSRV